MRAALLILVVSAPAFADTTTISLGGSFGVRETPKSDFGHMEQPLGGGMLTMSFSDAPAAFPLERNTTNYVFRLVPELRLGFLANDIKAEGELGAGLRGELAMSTLGRWPFWLKFRSSAYLAVRGEVIGEAREPAADLAVGEYIYIGRGSGRFGFEGSVMFRRSTVDGTMHSRPIPMWTAYVGWSL